MKQGQKQDKFWEKWGCFKEENNSMQTAVTPDAVQERPIRKPAGNCDSERER